MKKTICLFFSNDTSFSTWKYSGIIEREIKYYKSLIKKNFKVIFLTFGDKKDKKIKFPLKKEIKIIPIYEKIKRPKNYFLRNLLNIFLPSIILRKENFQIIKSNQLSGGLSALITSIILKKKIFFRIGWEPNIHFKFLKMNYLTELMYKYLAFIVYNFGNFFSVSSNQIRNFLLKKIIIGKKRKYIKVLENFIDTNTFKNYKKKRYNNRVLLVSRLSKEKNINFLIEALQGTDIKADIIGTGREKNNLIKYAKEKNVDLNFLGRKNNYYLPKYLNSYYVYVICSKIEGNVKSLLEAMSCQLICIGTNVNGIKNILKNNKTGLIVNNPLELRGKLINVFKNLKKFKFLGKFARKRVLKLNSIENFLKEELKILTLLK